MTVYRALLVLLLYSICHHHTFAQQLPERVKYSEAKTSKKCKKYYQLTRKLPIELRYDVQIENGNILFYFPDKDTFWEIYDKKYDGFIVDIVQRDQFTCDNGVIAKGPGPVIGDLQIPLFKRDLLEKMHVDDENRVYINCGRLPKQYDNDSVEANLVIIQKKFICDYQVQSHMIYNDWNLLHMGLYSDSVELAVELESLKLSKEMALQMLFQKNDTGFEPHQMQIFVDSLKLSDFNIDSISIKAYSSIEGRIDRNKKLQEARAASLVRALETFQNKQITYKVKEQENWKAFYDDVKGTKFEYLVSLDTQTIRNEVKKLMDSDELESILSNHRKGEIKVWMTKKIEAYPNADEITKLYNQQLESQSIQEALFIQNYVFQEVRDNRMPDDFIGQLEIPESTQCNPLRNNAIAFRVERGQGLVSDHIAALKKLVKSEPKNQKYLYNLIALRFRLATKNTFPADRKEIWEQIKSLNEDIDQSLKLRLKINFHLLSSTHFDIQKDFRQKAKSLREIYSAYKKLDLSDTEMLSLARFLAGNSRFKWTESILEKRAYDDDATIELLDYYIRLTIKNSRKVIQQKYNQLLHETIEKKPELFCQIFDSVSQGGVTFQLLDNSSLNKMYCENCLFKKH